MTVLERLVAQTFVECADTLVADFDPQEFLHRLSRRYVELLSVDAAGLLLADAHDLLAVVAASDEHARTIEVLQLQADQGPCVDCYRTGEPVSCPDLSAARESWPAFIDAALEAGFASAHALPLRLRDEVIGAVNLFTTDTTALDQDELAVAQALADMATIGILHNRAYHRRDVLVGQLQHALNSRVIIEQAKGALTHRHDTDPAQAFTTMRAYARQHNRRLVDIAAAVVERSPEVQDLLTPPQSTPSPNSQRPLLTSRAADPRNPGLTSARERSPRHPLPKKCR